MNSLSVMPPTNCLAEHGAWRGRVGAAGVALALHAGVLGLLLSWFGLSGSAAGVAFIVFEDFVAALQAYIFTLLTAVYIDSSVRMH